MIMKIKKNNWLIFLSVATILFMSSTCDKNNDRHNCITFVNKSNMEIYVSWSTKPINTPNDTITYCGNIETSLIPDSKFDFGYGAIDTWDDFFCARPYVQFMVFSKSYSLDGCTEEYLKDFTEKHQLKRYQLTKEDLDRMDWTVVFPLLSVE